MVSPPALPDKTTLLQVAPPSVWEDAGLPIADEGPRTFTALFELEPDPTQRYWLRFDGVSYETVGHLNGIPIGIHRGIWDAFTWEITHALHRGQNWLTLHITKNGGARFPVPQVLSGFLPYASSTFGGVWQPIWLYSTGAVWLSDLWVRGEADGTLKIMGHAEGALPTELQLLIEAPTGEVVYQVQLRVAGAFEHTTHLEAVETWSPENPALYRCRAELWHEGRYSHRVEQSFGFRTFTAEGANLLLNGRPFYLRGLLHWGWYLETHAPNPLPETAEQELRFLRSAGFNALKACLWVPPQWYLDLCNRLGVGVWLELPLWLPDMDAEQQAQARREYEAIVRQVRHHPSILIWTLGCELSTKCPPALLADLYALVKQLTGSPMVRDNSGGGECYGGALIEHTDFADYHLYTDVQFARTTFRTFLDSPRPPQPWLQGEFCDHDTMRDFITLRPKVAPHLLWWLERDPQRNPQGVRWFYETPFVEERLQNAGIWEHLPHLVQSSRQDLITHHKITLETLRALPNASGYIITGLKDTPITTSGLLDEQSKPKIDSNIYRCFNADTVLLLDWHRRRVWEAGGDRPANPDPYNHFAGQTLYPHLIISHYGEQVKDAEVYWRLLIGEQEQAHGHMQVEHRIPVGLSYLGTLELEIPPIEQPTLARFQVELHSARRPITQNSWEWGIYPRPAWHALGQIALYDPLECFDMLPPEVFIRTQQPSEDCSVLLATLSPAWLAEWVQNGGRAMLVLARHELPYTHRIPFWREACHLFLPHSFWQGVGGIPAHLSERLFAFSTDFALVPTPLLSVQAERTALWRRVDARTGFVNDYLVEERLGKGEVFITTLHFAGAHGDTSSSLRYHPAGQYWLYALLHYLLSR